MAIWGRVQGFCGYCGAQRDWLMKEDGVVCGGCGTKRKMSMPPQGMVEAHCGYCGHDRDWIVTAKGNYICLGCGTTRK